ncbi:MAG: hypothetical protein MI863_19410 [Desulfobacterales bacterium]|nr:hypothetical protein [Desulfobacterales bacterium]
MPLVNFGSILGFAEELEQQHLDFYTKAAALGSSGQPDFSPLVKSAKKKRNEVRRIRRENVTEMILETISGFVREPFVMADCDPETLSPAGQVEQALAMIDRSLEYYEAAALKLAGQAEVARGLKQLKKKHQKDRKILAG